MSRVIEFFESGLNIAWEGFCTIPLFARIIIAIAIIILIFLRVVKIDASNSDDYSLETNFGNKQYQREILNSIPEEDRLDYSNLYNRISEINQLIGRAGSYLEYQQSSAIDDINKKIIES